MQPITPEFASTYARDVCDGSSPSDARRRRTAPGEQRSACRASSLSPICFDGREPRVPAKYAAMVDWPHGTRSANSC